MFSKNDTYLGTFTDITHKIDMGEARPVYQKMRRTSASFEGEEKSYLEDLLKADVIEPLKSEWASPPVLLHKKDGRVSNCIDLLKGKR